MTKHLDERQLNDCADDALTSAERSPVDAHMAECGTCRERVDSIRQLRADLAALPRDIAPPAHILMGVRAEIAAGSAQSDRPTAMHAWYARPRLLAAAAVLLVALSSATTAVLLRDTTPVPDNGSAAALRGSSTGLVAVHAMERTYEDAIAEVQRALREQQSELTPETLRVLQANLDIIDRALAESRTALHADPGNDALAALLRSGYERKLDVLRSASSHSRARS